MIFRTRWSRRLNHMRSFAKTRRTRPPPRYLIPEGRPWRKTYFEFSTVASRSAVGHRGSTRTLHVTTFRASTGRTTNARRALVLRCSIRSPPHCGRPRWCAPLHNDLYSQLEQKGDFPSRGYPAINAEGEFEGDLESCLTSDDLFHAPPFSFPVHLRESTTMLPVCFLNFGKRTQQHPRTADRPRWNTMRMVKQLAAV